MAHWKTLALIVRDVLDGQRVEDLDRDAVTVALAYGLIENPEQTKPCPTCGTPRHDFRFWRVTPAGRLLSDAYTEAATQPQSNGE